MTVNGVRSWRSRSECERGEMTPARIPDGLRTELPQLAALFVVRFDIKKGYTLDWHRCIPSVKLEDTVEYKCLPSGLHTVKEDLVYFVHDGCAGVSAFVSSPAPEHVRNASLLALGVLVPLGLGRLGKCWRHAEMLKSFARTMSECGENPDKVQRVLEDLEVYWSKNRLPEYGGLSSPHSPLESPSSVRFKAVPPGGTAVSHSQRRNRSVSEATALGPSDLPLSACHPALSMPEFINTFGPLLFPLHRAALLRKRILFVGQAPIERACNFVYDLSVLSSIPSTVNGLLADDNPARLRSLFAVGVHDIPFLREIGIDDSKHTVRDPSEDYSSSGPLQGWAACTTDSILATKRGLYDIVVHLPQRAGQRKRKVWPKIETWTGKEVRATQRDSRRYAALMKGLLEYEKNGTIGLGSGSFGQHPNGQHDVPSPALPNPASDYSAVEDTPVEPMSWAELAYSSFVWWASAGEQQADFDSETAADDALMKGLDSIESWTLPVADSNEDEDPEGRSADAHSARQALPLVVYFRRLTSTMISTVADIIGSVEDGEDNTDGYEADQGKMLKLDISDISRFGVDVWSTGDVSFVKEFISRYFDREAEVESIRIECCGLRIC